VEKIAATLSPWVFVTKPPL
jgi:hypothetical protein